MTNASSLCMVDEIPGCTMDDAHQNFVDEICYGMASLSTYFVRGREHFEQILLGLINECFAFSPGTPNTLT
jgi:hypothetical protein